MLNFEVPNTIILLLMIVASALGGFDVLYYHIYKFQLYRRPDSRGEVVTHLLRGIFFSGGAFILLNYKPTGFWFYFVSGLFILDFINSIADVYLEPKSRAPLGGLPPYEYIIHIVGSVLEGAIAAAFFILFWVFRNDPSALIPLEHGALPVWLVIQGNVLVVGSIAVTLIDGILFCRSFGCIKNRQLVPQN